MATSRRNAIKNLVLGSAAMGVSPSLISAIPDAHSDNAMLKDNIHQSACYWCYHSIELDPFCAGLKQMGLQAVDLLQPDQLPVAKKYGLTCPMCYGGDSAFPTAGTIQESRRDDQKLHGSDSGDRLFRFYQRDLLRGLPSGHG